MSVDQNVRRLRVRSEEQLRQSVRETAPLETFVWRPGQLSPRDAARETTGWQEVESGLRWGGPHSWATFKVEFRVPQQWKVGTASLALPVGGQGMAYLDGQPWQGLDPNHRSILLPEALHDGQLHQLIIEAYAAAGVTAPRAADEICEVSWCGLQRIDQDLLAYGYDLQLGADTLRTMAADHPARASLAEALLTAERLVDRRHPESDAFVRTVQEARTVLSAGLAQVATSYPVTQQILAMGHAHIDTAWLWSLAQTRRKVVRSWSTVLRLMERYPEYRFLASQPQQYKWLEEDEPELYAQIEARIREGRWEPAGAMWIEPDVNLTAGESLVRQLVYGQRYLQEHFGRRCGILWLPDAFGYTAALPQILRGAGVHTFVTSKLSWNAVNRMPHDTFRWRGLDGTEVLAFFITAGVDARVESWLADPDAALRDISTYNGHMTAKEVASAWERYNDKQISNTVLYPFGWGDGGGGANAEMLETAARLAAYPGLPKLTQGNADEFLQGLSSALLGQSSTPVWDGELYLEYHRGTYSGQGGVKAGNRRGEHALHDAELWAAWATLRGAGRSEWRTALVEAWEILLLNQFHDILPGSSVGEVYVDQARDHARVLELAAGVRSDAQELLAPAAGSTQALTLFSSLPWARTDIAVATTIRAGLAPLAVDGTVLPTQQVRDLDGTELLLIGGVSVPSHGYTTLQLAAVEGTVPTAPLTVSERRLENQFFLLELDEAGRFSRLYDKRYEREVLAPGALGNRLLAFEDKPLDFDAWDIDSFYTEKSWELEAVSAWQVVETGPLRAGVEIRREWDGSTVVQRILLHAAQPRIDIQTEVDWHHHQVLLKAEFPLAVRATQARYECAFGWVERPTHRNTSWDAARFEVAGHRWADLSETGYGVSLLNDSKYGYDCLASTLRLTLLKSGIDPDPEADQGIHHFSYALLPHGPEWTIADTVREGYAFNLPASVRQHTASGTLPVAHSLVTTSSRHAVLDTIKPAEDGDGLIVRVYECAGGSDHTVLEFAAPIATAVPQTLLEEPDTELPAPSIAGNRLSFTLPAFGLRSFRVHLSELP